MLYIWAHLLHEICYVFYLMMAFSWFVEHPILGFIGYSSNLWPLNFRPVVTSLLFQDFLEVHFVIQAIDSTNYV